MPATAEAIQTKPRITRLFNTSPVLRALGRTELAIRVGTTVEIDGRDYAFETDISVDTSDLAPGADYGIKIDAYGKPFATPVDANPLSGGYFAGFHFAPSGNAVASEGGDGIPAINPASLWDIGFRPACADPRGMTLVETPYARFWSDIYLLGTKHTEDGTSRCGAVIATGKSLPARPDGNGVVEKLDYATAAEIYSSHGKRLMGAEEFFAAAYGVREYASRSGRSDVAGTLVDNAARFVSRNGLFDATGTMWQWGTNGHPDNPRPSFFGGSWINGGNAGSRYASLDYWPENAYGDLSARGACGHLSPA